MAWSKTEAGRQEIQSRAKVTGRAQRTLLLLVDGRRSDAELLAAVRGTSAADFTALAELGLIAAPQAAVALAAPAAWTAVADATPPVAAFLRTAAGTAPAADAAAWSPTQPPETLSQPPASYAEFTRTLTELISRELGLRGFGLTLAVEKAGTNDELTAVAERVIAAVRERRGPDRAGEARRALYGEG